MRTLVMVVALVLLSAGEARAAGKVQRVESATRGGTLADGDRYAAWVRGPLLRVLDEHSGNVASFPIPRECRPPGAIGAGVVATICGTEFRTLDLATGAWSTVPATAGALSLFTADSVDVTRVGAGWIEVWVAIGYRSPSFPAWINRATGDETNLDAGDLHKHVDLDAAKLWVPLCSPLTRRKNPEWDADSQYGSQYIGPSVVGTRALDVRRGDLVLRTCGAAAARVITRSPRWEGASFASTRVSWIDQDRQAALYRRERGRARVRTFDLVTGRVGTWAVPGAVNPNVSTVHTRRHVFVDKRSDGYTHRYAIDLTR